MKLFVFIYEHLTIGGTQTLIFRMANWLKENKNAKVKIICKEENENSLEKLSYEFGLTIKYVSKLKVNTIINEVSDLNDYGSIEFIVFQLIDLFLVEKLQKRLSLSSNSLTKKTLYVVHYNGLKVGMNLKIKVLKNIIKNLFLTMINFYLDNSNIIFMDEKTISETENYYNIKVHKDLIFRLPVEIKTFSEDLIAKRSNNENFEILTIARAEFPFKGYIFGLIDDFRRLYGSNKNILLTIITSGDKSKLIINKISELSSELQIRINVISDVPYNQLDQYLIKASCYIGMGTTVLEAANTGLPVLTSTPYTFDNKIIGYFHENPRSLGDDYKSINGYDYLLKLSLCNKNQYYNLAKQSYKSLEKTYNIEVVMNKFVDFQNNQTGIFLPQLKFVFITILFELIKFKSFIKKK